MGQIYSVAGYVKFPLHRWSMGLKNNPTFSPCLRGAAHAGFLPRQKWFLLCGYPETWTQIHHEKKIWQVKIGKNSFITLIMTEMCPFAHNPSIPFFSFSFFSQATLSGLSIHSYHLTLPSLVKLCITCVYTHLRVYTHIDYPLGSACEGEPGRLILCESGSLQR